MWQVNASVLLQTLYTNQHLSAVGSPTRYNFVIKPYRNYILFENNMEEIKLDKKINGIIDDFDSDIIKFDAVTTTSDFIDILYINYLTPGYVHFYVIVKCVWS